ncbi:hypothetical protein PYW07_007191 [Mythimna separata]|uniref:Cilia- and flagella-associated protein 161 n=1 Tax=Mythimna separata TaxID=271217 RepID=A0AAD7Z2R9_MYTSE|nr:hypothetical protein PYW07_007191 [Mythimna separata]
MAYNNAVLIGNWAEERLKNEYEFKLFLKKRERRELLLQKSRTLFSNLLSERPMALSGKYVQYGYNVQLVASDMPVTLKVADGKQKYGLVLSILVRDRQVDYVQNICDGCVLTMSPILTPCCRNTFRIVSVRDEKQMGKKMNYGDEFLLIAENYGDPQAAPLYVRYCPASAPEPETRLPLRLSAVRDSSCRFTSVPLLPRDRLEALGSPVKTSDKLVIKNITADKSLCVMNRHWMQTFFGPECGVNCRNFIDIHGRYTAENIFTLVSDIETKFKD